MGRTILPALILTFLLCGCVSHPLVDKSTKSRAPSQPAQQAEAGATAAQGSKEAPPPAEPAAEPEKKTYVLKKGDSLWSIACEELKDCNRWQEIQYVNPDFDPNDIQPGQELTLP